MIEQLESRTLLAAWSAFPSEPGETPATAVDVGSLSGVKRYADSLGKSDRDDYIRFTVANRGNININLTGLRNNADIELTTASGSSLSTSDNPARRSERISRFINAGTYYLHISGAATGYRLQIQADNNWGTITRGGESRSVGVVFANDATNPISGKRDTWVLIHGWSAPGRAVALSTLAAAVDGYSKNDQVMLLDWSDAATTPNVFEAGLWAPAAAQFAAQKLASWGIASSRINIVGHSLGALVADELAANVKGDINRLFALDPATDVAPVNFSEFSRYSLSMVASNFATASAAATADEAFLVNIGRKDSIVTHSNVLNFFATIINGSRRKRPDAISKFFSLKTLVPASVGRFKKDGFEGRYEGVIDGQPRRSAWMVTAFAYKNKAGKTINVRP
jgi:pimeloyl-ACP methyl ester carboxylesterase